MFPESLDHDFSSSDCDSSSYSDFVMRNSNDTYHDKMRELALNIIEYIKRYPLDITEDVITNVQSAEANIKKEIKRLLARLLFAFTS